MKTPNYSILDEYEADLLDESLPRREEISEIRDRHGGDLLCYANPEHAEFIVRAVNSHYQLIEALEELVAIRVADNWNEINKPLVYRGITQDRGISERIDKASEILKLAKGK